MKRGTVYYFDVYGEGNTEHVIQAVIERLGEGDIRTVVVASSSGETAVRLAEQLRNLKSGRRCGRSRQCPERSTGGGEVPG